MSGLFGYFRRKSSDQTPNEQKKEEQESNNIFGGLMASARGYLKKNIELNMQVIMQLLLVTQNIIHD